jgi:hypothetical protein
VRGLHEKLAMEAGDFRSEPAPADARIADLMRRLGAGGMAEFPGLLRGDAGRCV